MLTRKAPEGRGDGERGGAFQSPCSAVPASREWHCWEIEEPMKQEEMMSASGFVDLLEELLCAGWDFSV